MSEENKQQTPKAEPEEPEKGPSGNDETVRKVIFSLCYLWGILFFLPLIMYKDDAAATRHANEGLVLLLLSLVGNVIFAILTVLGGPIGFIFGILAGVYSVGLLILGIIGIVYVVTDKDQPLPLVGFIRLLK